MQYNIADEINPRAVNITTGSITLAEINQVQIYTRRLKAFEKIKNTDVTQKTAHDSEKNAHSRETVHMIIIWKHTKELSQVFLHYITPVLAVLHWFVLIAVLYVKCG